MSLFSLAYTTQKSQLQEVFVDTYTLFSKHPFELVSHWGRENSPRKNKNLKISFCFPDIKVHAAVCSEVLEELQFNPIEFQFTCYLNFEIVIHIKLFLFLARRCLRHVLNLALIIYDAN